MAEFKTEMTASACSKGNMTSYGLYTIKTKLPNVIDGLKLIHRRILVTLHDITVKEHKSQMKEATLVGRTMEMHPHGDQSIADAISKMCQPFSHIMPLVYSKSNIGTYAGKKSAAARYVDVGESEITNALYFSDINMNMLRMIPRETEDGVEPANLIPRLPTALFVASSAIALGYKTDTVGVSLADLCTITKEYIKLRASDPAWAKKTWMLYKYALPDFATYCRLRNSKQLLASYKTGDYSPSIIVDGTMRVTNDMIAIETLPPGSSFKNNTTAVGSQTITDKTSWESRNFQQMEDFSGRPQGIMKGEFRCIVKRGMNPFDVLARLKKELQFTSRWKPERRYVDAEGRMSVETPITLLDKWYTTRYDAVLGDLKQKLNAMEMRLIELMALIIVADHAKEVSDIFCSAPDIPSTIPILVKRFKDRGLTQNQAKYLSKLPLGQLTHLGREELVKSFEKTKLEMVELQKKFTKINDIMIESIEKFEQKYAADFPRRCVIPKYIGVACYRKNGWILLDDESECDQILKDFDPEQIEFTFFQRAGEIISILPDEDYEGDVPKYIKASLVTKTQFTSYTACVCESGGAMVLEGLSSKIDQMKQVCVTGKKFTAITKQGYRQLITVDSKIIRKSAATAPTMKDVIYVSPVADDDVFVIHASDAQPNYLVIERVSGDNVKLKKLVVGKWQVLGVYPASADRICINVPKELRARCTVRHIVLEHLDQRVPPNSKAGLLYGRGSSTSSMPSNFELVPWKRKSTIWTLAPAK